LASVDADCVAGNVIPAPEPDGVVLPTPNVVTALGVVNVEVPVAVSVPATVKVLPDPTLRPTEVPLPAAAKIASTDANTLDDYEEGTWTPSVGGTATYTVQNGKYTKVGRMVTISCYMGTNNIGTGSTTVISGLPFTCSTYGGDYAGVQIYSNLANSFTALQGNIGESATTVRFIGLIGGTANITNNSDRTVFGNNADISFTGTYFV